MHAGITEKHVRKQIRLKNTANLIMPVFIKFLGPGPWNNYISDCELDCTGPETGSTLPDISICSTP